MEPSPKRPKVAEVRPFSRSYILRLFVPSVTGLPLCFLPNLTLNIYLLSQCCKASNGSAAHTLGSTPYEVEELEKLYDRLSESARKELFLESVRIHPLLIREWYKRADTTQNMETQLREKANAFETRLKALIRVDVDLLTVGQPEAWWKDGTKLEAARTRAESRESNAELDKEITAFCRFLADTLAYCHEFLSKGHIVLAQFSVQRLLSLFLESIVSKDGLLSSEEESRFFASIGDFHAAFIRSNNITYVLRSNIATCICYCARLDLLTHSFWCRRCCCPLLPGYPRGRSSICGLQRPLKILPMMAMVNSCRTT